MCSALCCGERVRRYVSAICQFMCTRRTALARGTAPRVPTRNPSQLCYGFAVILRGSQHLRESSC